MNKHVHTCNPSTPEAKAGGFRIQGQLGVYSESETSLDYRVKRKKEQRKEEGNEGGSEGEIEITYILRV
jgi:hypothetical protein